MCRERRVHVVGIGHRPRCANRQDRDWSTPRVPVRGGRLGAEERRSCSASLPPRARRVSAGDASRGRKSSTARPKRAWSDTASFRARARARSGSSKIFTPPAPHLCYRAGSSLAGVAYLEAASAGLPVIATTEGGAGELLGDAAISVHPDDEDNLVAAMRRLCEPDTAELLGHRASTCRAIHLGGGREKDHGQPWRLQRIPRGGCVWGRRVDAGAAAPAE